MAFLEHSTDDHRVPHIEYKPCGAVQPQAGMAMVMEGGLLAAASDADKPTYLCVTQKEAACAGGESIAVYRVQPDMVLETTFSADAAAVKVGDKLTISDDGMQVTATTGGSAEVVYMDGTAEGSMCRVRFV